MKPTELDIQNIACSLDYHLNSYLKNRPKHITYTQFLFHIPYQQEILTISGDVSHEGTEYLLINLHSVECKDLFQSYEFTREEVLDLVCAITPNCKKCEDKKQLPF